MTGVATSLAAVIRISLSRGIPRVTLASPRPAKWNVFSLRRGGGETGKRKKRDCLTWSTVHRTQFDVCQMHYTVHSAVLYSMVCLKTRVSLRAQQSPGSWPSPPSTKWDLFSLRRGR